jgi:hypothetical protein
MARIPSSDPDQIVYRSGGGCLAVFGLPFLAAGLAVLTMPLWGIPLKDSKTGKPMPWFFSLVMGVPFTAVGVGLVFGRGGKVLDRRAGTLTTWWGLLVPWKMTTRPLSDFASVSISREVRRTKNSSYTVYPVRLDSGERTGLTLEEPRDTSQARRLGEDAAKFLNVRLVDRSLGDAIVREAVELDESLRERARRTGERPPLPEPPPACRASHQVVGDALVFDLPAPGFRIGNVFAMAFGLLIPLVVVGIFVGAILPDKQMPSEMKLVLALVLGVFCVLAPLFFTWAGSIRSARARTQVEVSPDVLRVRMQGLFREQVTEIPTSELEELQIIHQTGAVSSRGQISFPRGSEVILARSDRTSVTFGVGLSRPELEWIKAVIENVVTA